MTKILYDTISAAHLQSEEHKEEEIRQKKYDMAHIIHHATKQVSVKRYMNKLGKQSGYKVSKEKNKFRIR